MNPRYTAGSNTDLLDLADWYEAQQAGLGTVLGTEVTAAVSRIVAQPRGYPRVARPPRGREIRNTKIARFPVMIVYEVTATEVVILSITHARSARRPWRQRLSSPPPPPAP